MTKFRTFKSIDDTKNALSQQQYISSDEIATTTFLAQQLQKPLLTEGPAGVGKTELAKAIAAATGRKLIRLQCYEGLDVNTALYEWNYQHQLLRLKISERDAADPAAIERTIFGREFLLERPLLRAITRPDAPPVLLIDEIDRADDGFEAFLLELLSDFQVTIPELGTLAADEPPLVVVTSNRTREIHDALKRRCFYYWVDYPSAERELQILKVKAPNAPANLSKQIVGFVQKLRSTDLFKLPGVAETIDWANALVQLDQLQLEPDAVNNTLGVLLKYQDDIAKIHGSEANRILSEVKAEIARAQATA